MRIQLLIVLCGLLLSQAALSEEVLQTCYLTSGRGPFSKLNFSYEIDVDGYLSAQEVTVRGTWVKLKSSKKEITETYYSVPFENYVFQKSFDLFIDAGSIYSFRLVTDDAQGIVAFVTSGGDIDTFAGFYACDDFPFDDK